MIIELKKHAEASYIESIRNLLIIANGEDKKINWKEKISSMVKAMDLIDEIKEAIEKEQEKYYAK